MTDTAAERNAQLQTALKSATLAMAFVTQPETWRVFVTWLDKMLQAGNDIYDLGPENMEHDMLVIMRLADSVTWVGEQMQQSGKLAEVASILREKGLIGREG